jgi:hypothetical protein
LKELRTLLFQRALYNYHAVMYFKKEIIISFFIITISASDLYMPMIWLYLFLLDFLIPFLCDPDLQCTILHKLIILNFEGAKPHLVFDAHAEHTRKELMRMLSMHISSLRVCSAWFAGTSI